MLNHVVLLGRLAEYPELRKTASGISVTRFDLAVPTPGDRDSAPDYIPVVCWKEQAEFVNLYLNKGRQVVVEGRISTRKYTDKDGKNRKTVEVVAYRVYFADSNTGNRSADDDYQNVSIPEPPEDGDDRDLPF